MRRMRQARTAFLLTAALAVAGAGLVTPAVSTAASLSATSAATPFTNEQGKFTAVGPTRIMDTRSGLGGSGHVGPAHTVSLQVAGAPSGHVAVPAAGAEAVVLNLTVTGPTSSGFVTVFPAGVSRPNVSTINFKKGWTGANLVTVKLGTAGKIGLYNSGGTTDLIVDVVGWYADATVTTATNDGAFQAAVPGRLWDSRPSSSLPGDHSPMGGLGTLTQPVDFQVAGTNAHVKALVVTLTALNQQTTGHLTAWSGSGTAPSASVLNYTARTTVSNLAIVPTIPCPSTVCSGGSIGLPSFKIINGSNGTTDILIDIWGFYDDGSLTNGQRFKPLAAPIRIVDTRKELSGLTTLGSASTRTKAAPASVAGTDTQALVQNVTSIPAANTFLTFWRSGDAKPGVSNISPRAGRTFAGLAYTLVGLNNDFKFYNATGTNDVLVDVAGSMELPDPKAAQAAKAWRVTPAALG
jgi:hypothetical protein